MIIEENWNTTIKPQRDRIYKGIRSQKEKTHHKRNVLLTSLKFMDFEDSYELFNEDQQLALDYFTYQQYISKQKATAFSRIDTFQIDNETSLKLNKFATIDTKAQLQTDHNMIHIKLDLSEWINRPFVAWKQNANKRPVTIWSMDQTSTEQQEKYCSNIEINLFFDHSNEKTKTVDQIWKTLKTAIQIAANNYLKNQKFQKIK